jgi:hypothetical protein
MDEWEDYPIKVMIMAPLIMISLPSVSSFFSTRGCFLRGGWSPAGDPRPLSLACGWPSGANDSSLGCWRRLGAFRVEDPSRARKTGPNRCRNWAGPAGLGPIRPSSVAPFAPCVLVHLCTLPPPISWFWCCYPRVQDGGSLCMKFDILRFNPRGCSS